MNTSIAFFVCCTIALLIAGTNGADIRFKFIDGTFNYNFNDASSWVGGKVPGADDVAIISPNKTSDNYIILLPKDPISLSGLRIGESKVQLTQDNAVATTQYPFYVKNFDILSGTLTNLNITVDYLRTDGILGTSKINFDNCSVNITASALMQRAVNLGCATGIECKITVGSGASLNGTGGLFLVPDQALCHFENYGDVFLNGTGFSLGNDDTYTDMCQVVTNKGSFRIVSHGGIIPITIPSFNNDDGSLIIQDSIFKVEGTIFNSEHIELIHSTFLEDSDVDLNGAVFHNNGTARFDGATIGNFNTITNLANSTMDIRPSPNTNGVSFSGIKNKFSNLGEIQIKGDFEVEFESQSTFFDNAGTVVVDRTDDDSAFLKILKGKYSDTPTSTTRINPFSWGNVSLPFIYANDGIDILDGTLDVSIEGKSTPPYSSEPILLFTWKVAQQNDKAFKDHVKGNIGGISGMLGVETQLISVPTSISETGYSANLVLKPSYNFAVNVSLPSYDDKSVIVNVQVYVAKTDVSIPNAGVVVNVGSPGNATVASKKVFTKGTGSVNVTFSDLTSFSPSSFSIYAVIDGCQNTTANQCSNIYTYSKSFPYLTIVIASCVSLLLIVVIVFIALSARNKQDSSSANYAPLLNS